MVGSEVDGCFGVQWMVSCMGWITVQCMVHCGVWNTVQCMVSHGGWNTMDSFFVLLMNGLDH